MSSRHFLFVVGARVFSPKIAVGVEFASHCADLATSRAAIKVKTANRSKSPRISGSSFVVSTQ